MHLDSRGLISDDVVFDDATFENKAGRVRCLISGRRLTKSVTDESHFGDDCFLSSHT